MKATQQTKRSPMEKCSLVCHLFTFPLGLLYILWVLLPEENLQALNLTYYPPKEWAFLIPVSALSLFVAIPILYFAMNSLTVPAPTSLDMIHDEFTRKPTTTTTTTTTTSANQKGPSTKSSLPEIYDLDPAELMWYPRKSENTN